MANGNSVVDDETMRRASAPIGENLAARAEAPAKDRPPICRAMVQQRCDDGQSSLPQGFVRLVGCHDPKARETTRDTSGR
jgi:hypothetical protein